MIYRHTAGPKQLGRSTPGAAAPVWSRIEVEPVGATLGALIRGVDLREDCDAALLRELELALREWKVLLFRDQHLDAAQHARFAAHWGELSDDQLVPTPQQNPLAALVEFTRDAQTVGLENELDLLCRQAEIPEYQCRFRWQPGSIAFWDNLAVQHYGASDYYPQRRVMARTTFYPRSA